MSLDDLPAGANPAGERVTIPKSAKEGFGLPVHEVPTVGAFVSGILGSAKDWQDNLLAGLPGQRERIARVLLSKSEGGLNLAMPPDVSKALMGYGQEVGQRFAEGALDFDEHRWRRGLVAYEQLESSIHALHEVWENGGYESWWRTYSKEASSYGRVSQADRRNIRARLDALAGIATVMSPRIKGADRKMPRPEARLRIGPNV